VKVYLLGGLGADIRVFHKLQFAPHLQPIAVVYLQPIPSETLYQYAFRLKETIDTTEPFALIGLSFGGWVTSALLQYIQPNYVVLISSNASPKELPWHYKIAKALQLYKITPVKMGKKFNLLSKKMMGVQQADNIALLKQIFETSNTAFTKWAIGVLLQNKVTLQHPKLIRIHGDSDYILPINKQNPNYIIAKGGHLIVLENAAEVSAILNKVLI
jgi:pimeloyl-ACP methyl ester carboxylesterase